MNKLNVEKILGYTLLIIGLLIIAYSAINVINVFQGKTEPINLFSFDSISIDLGGLTDLPNTKDTNLKQELVQADLLNKPINIATHLFLMSFIVTIGFKVAQLGTMLVRPVKVRLLRKGDVEVKQ